MINLRLGFTETTLLFYFYLDTIVNDDSIKLLYNGSQNGLINWLYSTSGFYDKTIIGDYFNFDGIKCTESVCYNNYMNKLLNIIKKTTIVRLCFHGINQNLIKYKEQFIEYLGIDGSIITGGCRKEDLYNLIENKKVLIINPLSPLIKEQYDNNNVKYVDSKFPNVENIISYENPYTFFNSGPDDNSFETVYKICNDIKNLDFNVAVISSGAISSLLAEYINTELGKDVLVYGGMLSIYFGIDKNNNNIGWISVPDKYKPLNYQKIENGRYW